ncbi:uncharacterized protein TRIADDRAFT_24488, partial [Trichoplax adhaerens]
RLQLPILSQEDSIMAAIKENPVTIICGETGCGKTTQVPQFLYEYGFTSMMIGVTEPRRVAAISVSKRVAEEMSMATSQVSYQIRYQGNATDDTRIKFMTDGILLKEVEKDFLLKKYAVIVLDEAHERSVFTDILIGLLSRIVPLRNKKGIPLKLIIMSATLRVADFSENKRLFPIPPPVVKVETRQYPVSVHFSKKTPENYVAEAYRKVCKIHRQLKDGGILVFLTGQAEISALCRKLRRTFPECSKINETDTTGSILVLTCAIPVVICLLKNTSPPKLEDRDCEIDCVDDLYDNGLASDDDESQSDDDVPQANDSNLPLYVLPLFSLLSGKRQSLVFQPPPEGTRLCVVATNIAETSITIPNIKYVVDSGKVKRRYFDKVTGISSFVVTWTSKASANQRAGRAGRTEPGHCYRLYSSAIFNNEFDDFSPPEMIRRPVDDLVLQMKAIGIQKVINFPFPTCPEREALQAAEQLLFNLGSLEDKSNNTKKSYSITSLGKVMSQFPVAPRYAKMLVISEQYGCLPYVITLVAALTVKDIFFDIDEISQDSSKQVSNTKLRIKQTRKVWASEGAKCLLGDYMVYLRSVGASEYAKNSIDFCAKTGLRYKAMTEIRKLRVQLTNTVNGINSSSNECVDPKMPPPTQIQCNLIRQIILAGMCNYVARKVPAEGIKDPKMKDAYQSCLTNDWVYIHPTSSLSNQLPEFVVYQEILETKRLYMKNVCAAQPDWFPKLLPSLCTFSKPLDDPPVRYDTDSGRIKCHMSCTFGPQAWPIPPAEVDYPESIEKYKWFAVFLLDGKIFPKLSAYSSKLLSSPKTMVKSWAKLQPRTESLLQALIHENIATRDSLAEKWKIKPDYLFDVYSRWLPQSYHEEVISMWPPVKTDE